MVEGRPHLGEMRVHEHTLHLVNRARLTLTGVREVLSFDHRQIALDTGQGLLTLRGEGLRIKQLDVESGNFQVEGTIDSATYSAKGERGRGSQRSLLQKLLR